MRIVNQSQLDRANYSVTCELDAHIQAGYTLGSARSWTRLWPCPLVVVSNFSTRTGTLPERTTRRSSVTHWLLQHHQIPNKHQLWQVPLARIKHMAATSRKLASPRKPSRTPPGEPFTRTQKSPLCARVPANRLRPYDDSKRSCKAD